MLLDYLSLYVDYVILIKLITIQTETDNITMEKRQMATANVSIKNCIEVSVKTILVRL